MSSPAAQPAPAPAGGSTSQAAAQPAARPTTPAASPETQRSSTPRLLRFARGAATAAALLTGVVATGTFDTSGVNNTPNVVAGQWVAAEEARVDIAQADLGAARAVAETVAGESPTVDLAPALAAAADAQARSGGSDARAGATAGDLVRSGLLVRDAVSAAADDPASAVKLYGTASTLAQEAAGSADAVAARHATDLQTGSRSALTATVGLLSTALLGAVLVCLALRTRRIVNIPLLLATAITGWLTYVSLNPSALPLDIDQRVEEVTTAATALQDVRQARQAEYATALGVQDVPLEEAAAQAVEAVGRTEVSGLSRTWGEVQAGHREVASADGTAAALAAIRATEQPYAEVERQLQQLLDARLEQATSRIGTPAAVTSGVALMLGLIAAAAAWSGLTRRLRDYR